MSGRGLPHLVLAGCALVSALAPVASPQTRTPVVAPESDGAAADATPGADALPAPLREVSFRPPLGRRLPPDLVLTDAAGRPVRLGALSGPRPAVVVPVYYECPMLCSLVMDGLQRALRALELRPGADFELVVFSIDPDERPALAAAARDTFAARLDLDGTDGLHFLTGDAESLATLEAALGFHAVRDEATGEYAHAAGVCVAAADGTLSRFLSGVDYPARDLRLALVEAGDGAVGDLVDQALLYCFRYDPARGRYAGTVLGIVRGLGVLTVAALAAFVVVSRRREAAREVR